MSVTSKVSPLAVFKTGGNSAIAEDKFARAQAAFEKWFKKGEIKRVLLINPPDGNSELFRPSTAKRRRYTNYPPYGLGVIAQHLRELNIEVLITNLNHEVLKESRAVGDDSPFDFDNTWKQKLDKVMTDFTPDLIAVTCMFTMTHQSLKRVCNHIHSSGIPIAIGGVHVTNDVERVLDDISTASIAFLREGDEAIKRFCKAVGAKEEIQSLGQVILIDDGQRLRFQTECQPSSEQMDVIPAYDLLEVSELSKEGVIGNFHGFLPQDTKFATVLSNRGCRAQCTFCSVRNFNGVSVRQRSVSSVLDELETLKYKHGIGHVVWLDDDLLKDDARTLELFNGMKQRNIGLTWDATNGVIASSCSDEIVSAMRDSGCIALNIGMESGNPKILRQVKKPGTVKTFLDAAEVFHRHPEIHARVFLMIGFPGETMSMINDTINVARKMDLDWYGITTLQPLPNTPIYDSMVEQGLIETVGSQEVRFNSGAYGKQDEVDLGLRMASQDFEDAFRSIPMDSIPTKSQLQDIWFFMNYHLNFHRLFSENRPKKIEQQFANLKALSDVISPEHCLALYFTGFLQYKLYGRIEADVISRLTIKIEESDYWRQRFKAFGLSVEDLKSCNFKNKEIPRIVPGVIPEDVQSEVSVIEFRKAQ
jgi:radical SAM superfamily enzyme YgiQ (UPF0313 family)